MLFFTSQQKQAKFNPCKDGCILPELPCCIWVDTVVNGLDINGLLFLTVNGQLILSAYSEEDAQALEKKLHSSVLKPHLLITGKFEFKNPVLYEFMHSSIDYFETFLQLLRGE